MDTVQQLTNEQTVKKGFQNKRHQKVKIYTNS